MTEKVKEAIINGKTSKAELLADRKLGTRREIESAIMRLVLRGEIGTWDNGGHFSINSKAF